jgi:hypothetical protein
LSLVVLPPAVLPSVVLPPAVLPSAVLPSAVLPSAVLPSAVCRYSREPPSRYPSEWGCGIADPAGVEQEQ